ncbi:MAG TPA: hypothetical protein VGR48_01710 [Terriglobales bacterium]|nr:hypothetical protein [Terriglobales bacterium]
MRRSPPMLCAARQLFVLLLVLGMAGVSGRSQAVPAGTGQQALKTRLKRELSFRLGRLPSGKAAEIPAAEMLQRAYQQKANLQCKTTSAFASSLSTSPELSPSSEESPWTPLGPAPLLSNASGTLGEQDYGPATGRVTAIAVDPNDSTGNTVYIGGANGGVWKSSNAAAADPAAVTWTALTDREATLATGAIAVHPRDSQVILVGTGEPNLALDSYYGLGILRSKDGGVYWSLISAADSGRSRFAGLGFSKIVFSTDQPSMVVAGASAFTFYPASSNSGQGLYYSGDYGVNWRTATVKDASLSTTQNSVTDVAYNSVAGKFFAAMAWHGIYSSSDGANWSRLPNQPGGSVLRAAACPPGGASTCPILRGEIAVRPGKNEMYVWYISGEPSLAEFADQGIWKTTDGGTTWTAISESGIENCGDFEGCGAFEQGWYSLELAAVPDGPETTDLYAGAANLYKCRVSPGNPACAASPFINLTHVYGCSPAGSLSHVHPNQHALSFQIANSGKAVMYFGNDGGAYRALDGYQLSSGTCGQTPNPFDNLNGTLGSLTALVSLSQHPTEAGTLLAGAQQNGTAATDVSHSGSQGTTWIAVNGGEGEYTAINPNNASQWFTANSGITIQSCSQGINCLAQDFQATVSGATLGGDVGAFATPYLLDPQASSRMVVGTCRVWRGNSDGSGFTALSYNFDTGSDTACSGAEDNLISSLATGGQPVSAGGSPVVYAGTMAGRIFASTNAAAGPEAWYDATPPETGYPISSLLLDGADSTGKTALASVMGFGVPHVWKTTDGGLSWTNVTGNLPDAPADSLLLDPDDHRLIYAGTDVGVFSAQIGGANVTWEQVGPSSAGNLLPNVPVTQLAMFKSGALKLLRAATYGRGAWELMLSSPGPDYAISLSNPVLTLFPNQEGSLTGELTALYGYSSPVTLSCEGTTLPDVCSEQTVTPRRGGASYTVTARHGSVRDFSFNILATGTDKDVIIHRAAASLHIVDFALEFAPGTKIPVSLTANNGSSTEPLDLEVQARGAFNGAVNLSCGELPSGAKCNFYPSATVAFTGAGSSTVTMTISTLPTTPQTKTLPITISALATGAPASKTQTVSLTVKNEPDFELQSTPEALSAHPGDTITTRLTLTAVNNYKGTVLVSCGTSTLAGTDCGLSSNTVYLTNVSTGDVTLTMKVPRTATAGSYTVKINTQDASGGPSHVKLLALVVLPDFVINLPQATVSVSQGGIATYTFQVSSLGGAFSGPITFALTGLPRNTTYSFTPTVVIPGSGNTTVTLKVMTSTVVAGISRRGRGAPLWPAMFLPVFGGLVFAGAGAGRRRRALTGIALAALFSLLLLPACGGGNGGGSPAIVPPNDTATPTGTYTLTVTATSGGVSHSTDLTLIVQ